MKICAFSCIFSENAKNKVSEIGLSPNKGLLMKAKNQVIWSWKESIGYTMIKLGHMVFKGVIWVHNTKNRSMVLKGVNWVHNDKIRSNGFERSNWVHNTKSGHMVLKGVNWVHNDKIRSNGFERSNLCTQYKIRWYGLERSQLGTICKKYIYIYLR